MADQLGLSFDVPRVAKRSTSRVVRRPIAGEGHEPFVLAMWPEIVAALDRAGVAPGESFYVARVPPPDRRSHLGDLNGPPGSRAEDRRALLEIFGADLRSRGGRHGLTARGACAIAQIEGGWRRVSELVQGGHLAPTGEKRENVPGHPARVLAITDRGRAALEATT